MEYRSQQTDLARWESWSDYFREVAAKRALRGGDITLQMSTEKGLGPARSQMAEIRTRCERLVRGKRRELGEVTAA